jgi:hypothetical protein
MSSRYVQKIRKKTMGINSELYMREVNTISLTKAQMRILRLLPQRGKSLTKVLSVGSPISVTMEHVLTAAAVHGKQRMVRTIEVNIFERCSEN